MSKKHISVIDLVGNYESGPVIKDKKPNHVISYSEDGEQADEPMALGKGFTKRKKRLKKEALGLFDVPYGSTITNVSHRQGDSYKEKEQDKEVAQRFFGGKSNLDSEESGPPANIDRVDKKEPINILEENEINDFFSFLRIKPKAKHKKLGEKMNQDHLELNKLANALRAKGFDAQANSVLSLTKSAAAKPPSDVYRAFQAWMNAVAGKKSETPTWGAKNQSLYGDGATINDSESIKYLSDVAIKRFFQNYTEFRKVKDSKDKAGLKKAIDLLKESFSYADSTTESGFEPQPIYLSRAKNWVNFSRMRLKGGAPLFWAFAHDLGKPEADIFYSMYDAKIKDLEEKLKAATDKYSSTVSGKFKWISHDELEFTKMVATESGEKVEKVYHWRSDHEGQDRNKPPCFDDTTDCPTKFGVDPVSHPEFSKFFKFKNYRRPKAAKAFSSIKKFAGPRPPRDPAKGTFAPVDANDKTKGYRATDKDGKVVTFKTEAEAKAHAEGTKVKPTTPTRRLTPMKQLTGGLITDPTSGNKFRKWVNEKHKGYADRIKLDPRNDNPSGWKNSYIRRAWKQLGDEYKASLELGSAGKTGPARSQLAKEVPDKTLIGYMLLPKDSELANARNSDENLKAAFLSKYFNATKQPTANAEAMVKRMLAHPAYSNVIRRAYYADLKATPDLEEKVQISAFNRQEAATEAGDKKKERDEKEKAKASGRVNLSDFYIIPEGGSGSTQENGTIKVGTVLVGKQGEHLGRMFFVGKQGDSLGLFTIRQRYTGNLGNTERMTKLTDKEEEALKAKIKIENPNQLKLWKKYLSEKSDFDQKAAGGFTFKSLETQREEAENALSALKQSDPSSQANQNATLPMPGSQSTPTNQLRQR